MQFGIERRAGSEASRTLASRVLRSKGFHIFSGSQNLHAASICDSQTKSSNSPCSCGTCARPVRVVNLGGGSASRTFPESSR